MKAMHILERNAREANDFDDRLPDGRSRCFDIAQFGGCGVNCPAFLDGECDEPQEIPKQEIIDEHGKEAEKVFQLYECFDD